jgi:hypothetical protein
MTRFALLMMTGALAVVATGYLAYARFTDAGQPQAEAYKECSSCTARHRALIESKKKWAEQESGSQ